MQQGQNSRRLTPYSFLRHHENLIAELRGLPSNESCSRLRSTRGLDQVMEKVLSKLKITQQVRPEEVLMDNWQAIIGEKYVNLAVPQTLTQDHILVIQVSSPVLREQLRFDERRILKAVQALKECALVKRIVWR